MKKTFLTVAAIGLLSVGSLIAGYRPAHASTTYVCTRPADDRTAKAVVFTDRAEDYLEAHGFTCTGD